MGAWFVDGGHPRIPFDDEPVSDDPHTPGRIVVLRPDGVRTEVATSRQVRDLELEPDTDIARVFFSEVPRVHPMAMGGGTVGYPVALLAVDRQMLLAGIAPQGEPVPVPASDVPVLDELDRSDDLRWAWQETDPARVVAGGELLGDRLWWFGADPEGSAIDRRILVNAYDARSGALDRSVDAGLGTVRTVVPVDAELWFTARRAQFLRVGRDDGVEVLALAADGSIRTVLAPNTVEVSETDPPSIDRPDDAEIAAHVSGTQEEFADLERFWQDGGGNWRPLSDGLTDVSVVVEGEWPQIELLVELRHPVRPGLLLRRRYPLYDERGRTTELWDPAIGIMEDLDTGYLPRAEQAVDGVLEF